MTQQAPSAPIAAEPLKKRAASRRGGVRLALAVILAVVLACAIGAFAMFGGDGEGDKQTRELHTVGKSTFTITIAASGELEAKRQTEIRSKLEKRAQIVEVAAEGTRAKAGDLLLKLSSEEIQTEIQEEMLRVETARSDLTAAENNYLIQVNENEAALRQSDLKVKLAEIELNKWLEGDDKQKLETLATNLSLAKSDVQIAEERAIKTQKLYDSGFESLDELKTMQQNLERTQADVKSKATEEWVYKEFERGKQIMKLQSDVEEAKAELERVQRKNDSQLASKEADRSNKRRQLQIREEKLAKLQTQLAATTIVAPSDGLVVYASNTFSGRGMMMMNGSPIQVGREVAPNELVMVLPETGQFTASVRVQESLAGRIRPGMPAIIRFDALANQPFNARVDTISVLAEASNWRDPNLREYTVKLDIDSAQDITKLKPAMRAEAEIVVGAVENTLSLPIQAIFREGAISYAYVPAGSRFERRPVMLGRRSSLFAEILPFPAEIASKHGLKGLSEGDRVLLREPVAGEALAAKFDDALATELAASMGRSMGGRGNRQMMTGAPQQRPGGAPGADGATATRQLEMPAGAQNVQVMGADGKPVKMDPKQLEALVNKAREDAAAKPADSSQPPAPKADEGAEAPQPAQRRARRQGADGQ